MSAPAAPAIRVTEGSGSIADRIRKPSPKLGHLIATIYGRGGVGKTTLLGTMPGKGLVIDIPVIEGGTMVLSDHADRIGVLQVTRWDEFDEVYNYLKSPASEYKWVAIDSLTAAQRLAKRKVLKEWSLSSDQPAASQQNWGRIGDLMAELFFRYKQLPLHVLFTAQEKLKDTGEGGALEYQPDISPMALGALIPSMFLVGRLYVREVDDPDNVGERILERRLRVGPGSSTITKTRTLPSRPLPRVIKEPNLENIFRYILGDKVDAPEEALEETGIVEIN